MLLAFKTNFSQTKTETDKKVASARVIKSVSTDHQWTIDIKKGVDVV